MDRIFITDLLLRAVIGLSDEERREPQDILINVSLLVDLRAAGVSDCIEDTVDYRALKRRVIALVETSTFHLAEALAERIAALCLDDPRVQQARVRVEKPGALRFARNVGVEVTRERG